MPRYVLLGDDRIKYGQAFNAAVNEYCARLSANTTADMSKIPERASMFFDLLKDGEQLVAKAYGKEVPE